MSYTINRSNHIRDEITLNDADETLKITVDLVIDDILTGYGDAMKKLAQARKGVEAAQKSEDPEVLQAAHTALGEGVTALFALLFGADQTQQLVAFYSGRYNEMLGDFLPYIQSVLLPEINKAKEAAVQRYTSWKS